MVPWIPLDGQISSCKIKEKRVEKVVAAKKVIDIK